MIVTKKYIENLREKSFFNISEDMKNHILKKFSKKLLLQKNGYMYEYTEQDIREQIRKMI